ncbi:YceI family protein [Actinomadura violacea]|uniref:YceI family protein n=1 Tax=Actinomadura violacea TaxID=2819934 RepID=A0ABS3S7C6_9ACTN|nr:YceI family protein [Actinomadura violacea]MBO2464902.1 YceI family protein [Actinomadura violacea]
MGDLTRTVDGREVPVPGEWVFEGGNSSLAFVVRHLVISKVRGHFRRFAGVVTVADRPEDSAVTVDIETASIETGMPARDRDLRGRDFLDAEAHPRMTYRSTGVRPRGGHWLVDGDLTIGEITRPVTLDVEFQGAAADGWGNRKAVFSAEAEFDREEWGVTYNQALETGGVLIGSKVKIEIEIQAKPKE